MTIDLKKFCSKDKEFRESITEPFSRGDWTYATNGHIAVRVSKLSDIPENKDAPDIERVFNEADKLEPYKWVSVPGIGILPTKECDACDGSGKREVDEEHTAACDECDGKGRVPELHPVVFDLDGVKIGLSNIYIDLIYKELPNPEIGLTRKAAWKSRGTNPVKIKFDGGQGLLMPCKV